MIGYKHVLFLLLAVIAAAITTGCSKKQPPETVAQSQAFIPHAFPPDTYMLRAQNFIVLVDVSASMGNRIGGQTKLEIARDFLSKLNVTLPEYPGCQYAIRTFGHNPFETMQNTRMVKGWTPFHAVEFNKDCQSLNRTGGQSPMSLAIDAVADDMNGASGEIAMFILSDGVVLGEDAGSAAKELKQKYGPRLSIYPVIIGHNPEGVKNMEELAWAGETGFYRNAGDIRTNRDMADYVRRIFLARYPDTDGDSIIDIKDECEDTPAGAKADPRGCWVLNDIKYEFDKWVIRPEYNADLENVMEVLNANPELKVQIQGHTDNVGTQDYNRKLSLKRAESVREFLLKRGITEDRLFTYGYGFSKPIASNETDQGRGLNRRVELQPIKIEMVGSQNTVEK